MFDVKEQAENCVVWIREYFRNNSNDAKCIIGISGGKDSSVAAALCVKALGENNVYGVLMPQGEQFDIQYSYDLCKFLGIQYTVVNINKTVSMLEDAIKPLRFNIQATINTPARIRMTTLYAIAAISNGRVCNNSNLSEDWVGYCTLWGDSVGSFSPLGNFTSDEVIEIGRYLGLPEYLITKKPIDGLQDKSDEESFGFSYEILNKYIRTGICEDINIKNKIDDMHEKSRFKFAPMPTYHYKTENDIF